MLSDTIVTTTIFKKDTSRYYCIYHDLSTVLRQQYHHKSTKKNLKNKSMNQPILTAWQRLIRLLALDKKDILQVFYYAIFAGVVNLSLPLGIQAIINLIQGAQISTSWIILVVLVTLGVVFAGTLQTDANSNYGKHTAKNFHKSFF